MHPPGFDAFERRGDLVQLEAPVRGVRGDAAAQRLPRRCGHRAEALRHRHVLLQHALGVHPADDGRDREAEGVGERLFGGDDLRRHGSRVAAQALHANRRDAAPVQLGQHLPLEAAERRVEAVQGQLTRIPWIVVRQHLQVERRRFVAGEADVADLALDARAVQRLDDAAAREVPGRLVVEDHLVNLPEVEVVGAQAPQRVFELPHRNFAIASVRADLGHEEDLVAAIGDAPCPCAPR